MGNLGIMDILLQLSLVSFDFTSPKYRWDDTLTLYLLDVSLYNTFSLRSPNFPYTEVTATFLIL